MLCHVMLSMSASLAGLAPLSHAALSHAALSHAALSHAALSHAALSHAALSHAALGSSGERSREVVEGSGREVGGRLWYSWDASREGRRWNRDDTIEKNSGAQVSDKVGVCAGKSVCAPARRGEPPLEQGVWFAHNAAPRAQQVYR
jgi:hypothetical protein